MWYNISHVPICRCPKARLTYGKFLGTWVVVRKWRRFSLSNNNFSRVFKFEPSIAYLHIVNKIVQVEIRASLVSIPGWKMGLIKYDREQDFISKNDMGGRYCTINSPRGSSPPWTEWYVNYAIPTDHVVLLHPHPPTPTPTPPPHPLYLRVHLSFLKSDISLEKSQTTQLNLSLWWRHNIYL